MVDLLEHCRPHIEAALDYNGGTHTWADIVEGIREGRFQLWPAEKSAILTELIEYPQTKHCHVFLGGGDLDEILGMHSDVIAWAKAQGCSALTVSGRQGWKKPLQQHGWKPLHLSMIKEFDT